MTKLSVNINKVATIRNARGNNLPDLIQFAKDCEKFGAEGITVHPRPDERHIRYEDVYNLAPIITTEFNIEGFPNSTFINLVLEVKPTQVTLVPDPPHVLTSNAGWDTLKQKDFLKEVIAEFKKNNIRTSIFVDTDIKNIEHAKETGTDRIELYTGPYAEEFAKNKDLAIAPYVKAANLAHRLGLEINAGHDLNLANLNYFITQIPFTKEVSIGHALICDALYYGINESIKKYLTCLK
ncbi:MAG: pyridoxine 5'-phosphate synthase [Vicingaceae bacterium]|nr:pyridoxine 5'-phosphate synthase [Vicingaceae bacterium]